MRASSLDNCFHISCHLFLNRSNSFPSLYAVGDGQGGHVVLDLQQGHGTRRKQSPWFSWWMGHYRLQGLQSDASRAAMERWADARIPHRPSLGLALWSK